jgi:hypothetical protein
MQGEIFEEQSNLKEMSMADAQINFRIRSRMIDTKMNQQTVLVLGWIFQDILS